MTFSRPNVATYVDVAVGPSVALAHLVIEVYHDEECTEAEPAVFEFVGEAKRHPSDKAEGAVGAAWAISRAFAEAAEFFAEAAEIDRKEDK